MSYQIRLENFEGPLDLLLYLVRKNEIDISLISITLIVDEYMRYLQELHTIDIDKAGDFLAMAATLLRLKARTLLPNIKNEQDLEEDDEVIIRRLLDYRRYSAVADVLNNWQEAQLKHFRRGFNGDAREETAVSVEDSLRHTSLFNLALAFQEALKATTWEATPDVVIKGEDVTVQRQMAFLLRETTQDDGMFLSDILSQLPTKLHIVTTFLALLEMIRLNIIRVLQDRNFGQIVLLPVRRGATPGAK